MSKTFTVVTRNGFTQTMGIAGENVVAAIESNFARIASAAGVGNAAGFGLQSATLRPAKVGAVLTIVAAGLDLAHRSVDKTPREYVVEFPDADVTSHAFSVN